MVASMVIAIQKPQLHYELNNQVKSAITETPYISGIQKKLRENNYELKDAFVFMPLIWLKNVLSSFLSSVFVSLFIPFLGALISFSHAIVFGIGFAPLDGFSIKYCAKLVLILLEGQGAIITAMGSILMTREVFKSTEYPLRIRYKRGITQMLRSFLVTVLVLFIAGVYESVQLLY
jgi:hypothetical protein